MHHVTRIVMTGQTMINGEIANLEYTIKENNMARIKMTSRSNSTKKTSHRKLIEKLDKIFSEYIRLRDVDTSGYGRCISSGKIVHWKEADAGHYINRAHMATRYHEKNVHLQSRFDNRFREGNMLGYTKGLIKKYGAGILDELEILKNQTSRYSNFDLQVLINEYTKKVKQLHEDKGI